MSHLHDVTDSPTAHKSVSNVIETVADNFFGPTNVFNSQVFSHSETATSACCAEVGSMPCSGTFRLRGVPDLDQDVFRCHPHDLILRFASIQIDAVGSVRSGGALSQPEEEMNPGL